MLWFRSGRKGAGFEFLRGRVRGVEQGYRDNLKINNGSFIENADVATVLRMVLEWQ